MPVCIQHTQDCLQAPVCRDVCLSVGARSSTDKICNLLRLKLSYSPTLLAEGQLRKPLASLIISLATCANMPNVGSCPTQGCKKPCLANSSANFISINFHVSWHPQDSLISIMTCYRLDGPGIESR